MKDAFKSSEFIQINVSSLDLHILILQFISFNRMGLDWGLIKLALQLLVRVQVRVQVQLQVLQASLPKLLKLLFLG